MGFNSGFKGLMSFIVNNQEVFQTNSSMHNINTRNERDPPHLQKSKFWDDIKIFSGLPPSMIVLNNYKAKESNLKKIPTYTILLLSR